jgi:general nucleoside transport system permease protein
MKNELKITHFWRSYLERSFSILIPLAAILAAFLVGGILIIAWGSNPLEVFGSLFRGAFGTPNSIATTLERLTPLVFTGLAVAYGYRSGFFNIGAEGQLYMGAIAALWVAIMFPNWPAWLLLPSCILASALAGMLWVLLPAFLKAKRGINEVLTTLLMNYIAIQYLEWAVRVDHVQEGILLFGGVKPVWTWINWIGIKDAAQAQPQSPYLVNASFMPSLKSLLDIGFIKNLFGGAAWYQQLIQIPAIQRMTLAPLLGVIVVILMSFLMFKTVIGYKARSVGANPDAAKYMGINVANTLIITALISGALGGLAGGMEVLGTQHRLIPNFLVNAGFNGIPVALIGQLNPWGALMAAIFFGSLQAGSNTMQVITSVPTAVVNIIQALAIMFAIAGTTIDVQSTLKKRRLAKEISLKKATQTVEGEVSNA